MLNNKTIAVVVPAYNEETQIGKVIDTMPEFVDRIVVVDDCSKDGTRKIVQKYLETLHNTSRMTIQPPIINRNHYNQAEKVAEILNEKELTYFVPSEIINKNPENERIILIYNSKNSGVGGAIARGYKWCKDNQIDCSAVMAGDGQMDPSELERICSPVVFKNVDYVKGNRLIHQSAWLVIPKIRYFGNSILSILTKIASGYWRISDTQTGYTAISLEALKAIRLHKIYKGYGMPNDLLVKLNIAMCTIREVPIKPVYSIGEKSKIKYWKVIPRISILLKTSFIKRLCIKYLFRDFHPLFFLYNFSGLLFLLNIPVIIKLIHQLITGKSVTYQVLIAFMFLTISCFQSLLFAMWMDVQDNERLYK